MKIKAENYLKRIDWAFSHVFLYLATIVFSKMYCSRTLLLLVGWIKEGNLPGKLLNL